MDFLASLNSIPGFQGSMQNAIGPGIPKLLNNPDVHPSYFEGVKHLETLGWV